MARSRCNACFLLAFPFVFDGPRACASAVRGDLSRAPAGGAALINPVDDRALRIFISSIGGDRVRWRSIERCRQRRAGASLRPAMKLHRQAIACGISFTPSAACA
ncbi:TPA: hypothetical protein QDB48_000368 [Burkholderia vietnamiensis]|nr:hypothetical protein [Burkholderia vietnamiensis]